MTTHDYQYDINSLLTKDSTGLVSSFVLQLDNILAEDGVTESTQRILDETIQFLHNLVGEKTAKYDWMHEDGYKEGYDDAENGYNPKY